MAEEAMNREPEPTHIFVTSLVSSKTLEPRVQIEIGECKTQCSAEKAREIALMILEASEAATSDAFLIRFLMEKIGAPLDGAMGVLLQEFRAFRDEQQKKEV